MNNNRICNLFNIEFPIIQAGMIWCSGWQLASAVSNAGGLGIIGSGSMYPLQLKENIEKCKLATTKPFAVNVPLLYPNIEEHIQLIIDLNVKIVFTSAGNPKTYTQRLKEKGIIVVHVVANTKFALKCVEAGVDAIVAEGFEAGGHNGKEETTTMCLIPIIKNSISIPIIAAGGIASGKQMLAAFALGAEAVQIGSRFIATPESSGHQAFKDKVISCNEGDTMLSLKKLTPVRLIKNEFYMQVEQAENNGASNQELQDILGRGRAKKGMYEGDLVNGELEVGQVAASIKKIMPAADVVKEIWTEFIIEKNKLKDL